MRAGAYNRLARTHIEMAWLFRAYSIRGGSAMAIGYATVAALTAYTQEHTP